MDKVLFDVQKTFEVNTGFENFDELLQPPPFTEGTRWLLNFLGLFNLMIF